MVVIYLPQLYAFYRAQGDYDIIDEPFQSDDPYEEV
jgi:hypothetical protein